MHRPITGPALRHLHRLFAGGCLAGMTDAQLIDRFADEGDEAAFAAIVTRHGAMVLGVCRAVLRDRHAAEDASQAAFLILARRAGSLRVVGDSIAGYLHRVAFREARRLDGADARRRRLERLAAAEAARRGSAADPDLRAAVHRAVAALPESLRLPVVLCHLEGKTHAQAAAELRRGEATVRRRLADARALLRSRLTREGIAPPAALLALLLRPDPATAADASARASSIARLASSAAAGGTALASASALGGRLLAVAIPARAGSYAALAVAALAIVCPFSTGGAIVAEAPDEPTPAMAMPAADAPTASKDDEPEVPQTEFAGRVVDPEGRPVPGAVVRPARWSVEEEALPPGATTDADGRFRLDVPGEAAQYGVTLVASADGYIPGWVMARGDDVEIRLVADDEPIEGRLLDLEGRPLAGVVVRPEWVLHPNDGDLSGWLEVARSGVAGAMELENSMFSNRIRVEDLGLPTELTTDADGRFRLEGVGSERLVELRVVGPSIRLAEPRIMTRMESPFDLTAGANSYGWGVNHYFGATFELVVAPSRPIEGVVRDLDTGAPLAGVTVRSEKFAEFDTYGKSQLSTTTDAEGRYRLDGMPPGEGNKIVAEPPTDQPYLGALIDVGNPPGLGPATVDFGLKRGIWIEGRVTDAETGEPVREGRMYYGIFRDDPHYAQCPGLDGARNGSAYAIGDDGSYRVPGLPGHGVVGVLWASSPGVDYLRLTDRPGGRDRFVYLDVAPSWMHPGNYNEVVEVQVPDAAETFRCDLELTPGRSLTVVVLDPDGRPLPGVRFALDNEGQWRAPKPEAIFELKQLAREGRINLRLRLDDHGLVGFTRIDLAGDGPVEARLQPWGVAVGRLVDEDGRPRAGVRLYVEGFLDGEEIGSTHGHGYGEEPMTDADGRFRIEGLIPGVSHTIRAMERELSIGNKLVDGLEVDSGQTRDLGDVREEAR